MGKYDDFVTALGKGGVPKGTIDEFITKFGKKVIDEGMSEFGHIRPELLKNIEEFLGAGSDSFKTISKNNTIISQRATQIAIESGEVYKFFSAADGKALKESFTPEEVARYFGKSTDDIARMADDVDVQNAAKTKKNDLIKLGISGSLVTGVIFLMLLTGKKNPVEAIAEALKESAKAAAKAAKDTGGFVFKNLFSGMDGLFNVSALFLFCSSIGIVLWLVISVVLKK